MSSVAQMFTALTKRKTSYISFRKMIFRVCKLFYLLICNILFLHNLSGVMDDEEDRHLLDILG